VDDATAGIAKYLNLNMPGTRQKLFYIDIAKTKERKRFRLASLKRVLEIVFVVNNTGTATPSTADGLNNDRPINTVKKIVCLR
jgi:short-subunit dehydrogenase